MRRLKDILKKVEVEEVVIPEKSDFDIQFEEIMPTPKTVKQLYNEGLGNQYIMDKGDLSAVQKKLNTMKSPPKVVKDKSGYFHLKYDNRMYVGPFHTMKDVLRRLNEESLNEDVLATLQKIAKEHQAQKVKFDNKKTMTVDATTANAIVRAYEKLNDANKAKLPGLLNKSPEHFMKVVDLAFGGKS
jgi:hypothetical protein